MEEEELKILENEFCLGCARSCDLRKRQII